MVEEDKANVQCQSGYSIAVNNEPINDKELCAECKDGQLVKVKDDDKGAIVTCNESWLIFFWKWR